MARSYDAEILGLGLRHGRAEALQRVRSALLGRTVEAAAADLGVPLRTLQHWLMRCPGLRGGEVDRRRKSAE